MYRYCTAPRFRCGFAKEQEFVKIAAEVGQSTDLLCLYRILNLAKHLISSPKSLIQMCIHQYSLE